MHVFKTRVFSLNRMSLLPIIALCPTWADGLVPYSSFCFPNDQYLLTTPRWLHCPEGSCHKCLNVYCSLEKERWGQERPRPWGCQGAEKGLVEKPILSSFRPKPLLLSMAAHPPLLPPNMELMDPTFYPNGCSQWLTGLPRPSPSPTPPTSPRPTSREHPMGGAGAAVGGDGGGPI